jgi:hydrogenase maturation protease
VSNRKHILIASLGNIFFGDDAFGVEVARALTERVLPPQVHVVDFGIRGYDLAYALTEAYDAIILVDAVSQGSPPGTVYLIEPDLETLTGMQPAHPDLHSLSPVSVLRMAQSAGNISAKIYLVGCEPAVLETNGGEMGLSEPVRAAIPRALELIDSLVCRLLSLEPKNAAGLLPA